MEELENYLQDGADNQARATLMFLQNPMQNPNLDAGIKVSRWENYREQGYIVSLRNKKSEQLNIAFFEHRNSDSICAVKWQQESDNTITIDTAMFGDVYQNKFDVSYSVGYGRAYEMAEWIISEINKHLI